MYRIPFMQRAFRKKTGIENMADYADKAVFYNNETGISVKWAGIHMAAIAISLEIVLFDIFQFLSKKDFYNYICAKNGQINQLLFIAILVGVTLFINYATIFKDKKYLIYFEEFERLPQKK